MKQADAIIAGFVLVLLAGTVGAIAGYELGKSHAAAKP